MAKRKQLASKTVTWTFEENEADLGWAVFISVGGVSTRLSPWATSPEVLADALKRITGLAPADEPVMPPAREPV